MSLDNTQAGVLMKLRKVVRYISLYGFARTLVKIKGQFHTRATAGFEGPKWVNPACRNPDSESRNVAIIGCGNYSFSNIAYYLAKRDRKFLRGACDIQKAKALSLCKAYGGSYAVADWRELLADPLVKIVFIASNHASHAEYAIACMEAGKHVHIEKPHVVNYDQLDRLVAAMRRFPESKVFLGFNRPRSRLFGELQQLLARESGPLMINWFIAGHEIPDGHWYYDEKEGGRVLGNLSHWSDLTLHLAGIQTAFPCTVYSATPQGSTSDFVVSAIFSNQSCVSITFSAKGVTFEGVREVLNVHKGNLLANLMDFHVLTVDIADKKKRFRAWHRDHGHQANIIHSHDGVNIEEILGEDISYVSASAKFILAIRQAIESGEPVRVS